MRSEWDAPPGGLLGYYAPGKTNWHQACGKVEEFKFQAFGLQPCLFCFRLLRSARQQRHCGAKTWSPWRERSTLDCTENQSTPAGSVLPVLLSFFSLLGLVSCLQPKGASVSASRTPVALWLLLFKLRLAEAGGTRTGSDVVACWKSSVVAGEELIRDQD